MPNRKNIKFELSSDFAPAGDQPKAIKGLIEGIEKGQRHQTLLGVTGSGKTFTVANVIQKIQKPTLVIAPNKTLAAQLYQEYKSFFPKNRVCYFVSYYDYYQPEAYLPTTDTYIEKEAMINEEIDKFRHLATSSLLTRSDVIVVASVSCIYNLGLPENYFDSVIKLEVGQKITRQDLMKNLVKIGFERNQTALKRGNFRLRGDVFEIQFASEELVYRIELKDQEVLSIAITEAVTRNIKEDLTEILIFPPKHFVTSLPDRERAIKDIKEELKERLVYLKKKGLLLEGERLARRTKYDMEMLQTLGFCHGIENYSRHLTGKLPGDAPDTLLGYFPHKEDGTPDFLTIIDESHISVPQVRGMFAGDRSRKETLVEHGWRLPSALDNRPLNFKEFEERVGQVVYTSATPGDYEKEHSENVVEQIVRPTGLVDPPIEIRPVFDKEKNRSQVDDVMQEAIETAKKNERTLILTLTKKMAEELDTFLKEQGFKSRYMHGDNDTFERTKILSDFRKQEFDILVGINLLREGLDLPEVSLVAILDADREGFLRNETSLIQTMGRAARNANGRVILYADSKTKSMNAAIKESERRRKIQLEYNKKHGITPKTIKKEIREFD
ncbi:MAG: excinuclease ABC subunit UvrB [Candidatus Paceibacterota bacterium]